MSCTNVHVTFWRYPPAAQIHTDGSIVTIEDGIHHTVTIDFEHMPTKRLTELTNYLLKIAKTRRAYEQQLMGEES